MKNLLYKKQKFTAVILFIRFFFFICRTRFSSLSARIRSKSYSGSTFSAKLDINGNPHKCLTVRLLIRRPRGLRTKFEADGIASLSQKRRLLCDIFSKYPASYRTPVDTNVQLLRLFIFRRML